VEAAHLQLRVLWIDPGIDHVDVTMITPDNAQLCIRRLGRGPNEDLALGHRHGAACDIEIRKESVDEAIDLPAFEAIDDGCDQHVAGRLYFIDFIVAEVVVEGAHSADIKRDLFVTGLAHNDSPPALGGMPNAKFVHNVRITGRDIDDDDIASKNPVDHIAMDEP
jgi:hypothetical protein